MKVELNLNETVKFKFTDYGKDIYFHRFDWLNESIIKHGGTPLEPTMPKEDEDGYSSMQLWDFMNLYGEHMKMGGKNVIQPLDLIFEVEG